MQACNHHCPLHRYVDETSKCVSSVSKNRGIMKVLRMEYLAPETVTNVLPDDNETTNAVHTEDYIIGLPIGTPNKK